MVGYLTICIVLRELERRQKQTGVMNPNMEDVLDDFQRKARDHARTPLQWNGAPHAGFTTGTPWMRVNDDYAEGWNVEAEMKDPHSVWHFWKRALHLRREPGGPGPTVLFREDDRIRLPAKQDLKFQRAVSRKLNRGGHHANFYDAVNTGALTKIH